MAFERGGERLELAGPQLAVGVPAGDCGGLAAGGDGVPSRLGSDPPHAAPRNIATAHAASTRKLHMDGPTP